MKIKRDLISIDHLVHCLAKKDINKDYFNWDGVCYVYNTTMSSDTPWIPTEHLQTFLGEHMTEDIREILKARKS